MPSPQFGFRPAFLFVGIGVTLLVAVGLSAQSLSVTEALLSRTLRLDAADLRVLEDGSAVIKRLGTSNRNELAYGGAVYLDASPERFIDLFRDIEEFEGGPGVPQIGRFSDPPRLGDLEMFTLPATDLEDLENCHPGDCKVKLSGHSMNRFRNEVDWSAPDAAQQATEVARQMVLNVVRAYQAVGNSALGHYADSKEPLSVSEQLNGLLANSDLPAAFPPEFMAYLRNYPRGRPLGTEDFFYWTVADFGLKPTIRVNHVTIYPLNPGSTSVSAYAIAIKQLYASHYFHTTLELRFLRDDEQNSDIFRSSLVSITRSRSDGMTGFKGLILRPIITGRSRKAILEYLEQMKQQVERASPQAP